MSLAEVLKSLTASVFGTAASAPEAGDRVEAAPHGDQPRLDEQDLTAEEREARAYREALMFMPGGWC